MNWELLTAKNGEQTLVLNGIQIYSRYRPREDAWKWIEAEFDATKSRYLLIGLGLGYHAERLLQLAGDKPVHIYYFDQQETKFTPHIAAVSTIEHIDFEHCQILIPNVWLKALTTHPIHPYLEDIKINQLSYKKYEPRMEENFKQNMVHFEPRAYPMYEMKKACLVASGPSLQETIEWLKDVKDSIEIFVVGSALKFLLQHELVPTAVIISDPKHSIQRQLKDTSYTGDLYFLSTASVKAVSLHQGPKYMLFQQGFDLAEQAAKKYNMPLVETGGSVSTVAISLLQLLKYEELVLFGQDMSFTGNQTHMAGSTSGRHVENDANVRAVIANNGETVLTTPNLHVYARWIEQKVTRMDMKMYTTSPTGIALEGISLLTKEDFHQFVQIKPTEM